MLTYKAAHQLVEGGVHAHGLGFSGTITCGADLAEARRLITSPLLDMVGGTFERGCLYPDPSLTEPDAEI